MVRIKKTPAELGYHIPVQRKLAEGRYAPAYAKTLEPDKNGNIKVRTDKGRNLSWRAESVIHVPQGFKLREDSPCL